jgi:hypothetical protein
VAVVRCRARRIRLVEAIEDVRQVLGRDAGAGVGHPQERGAAGGRRAERDRAAVRSVAQRVGDQVLDDLLEAIRIAGELIGVGRDVGADVIDRPNASCS